MKKLAAVFVIIGLGTWIIFGLLWPWAQRPTFSGGSFLSGGEETQLEFVTRFYGPGIVNRNYAISPNEIRALDWDWSTWALGEAFCRQQAIVGSIWLFICLFLLAHTLPLRNRHFGGNGDAARDFAKTTSAQGHFTKQDFNSLLIAAGLLVVISILLAFGLYDFIACPWNRLEFKETPWQPWAKVAFSFVMIAILIGTTQRTVKVRRK